MGRVLYGCALFVIVNIVLVGSAQGQAAEEVELTAPDGAPVLIDRDDFGIPHIFSRSEAGLFFGQGFAVAQDRLFQMELFRRAALGRLAEIDPSQAQNDRLVRTLFYTEAERQAHLEQIAPDVQTMIESFTAGVNAFLDLAAQNPSRHLPIEFAPGQLPRPEEWTPTQVVAVIQFFMRRFGQYGGEELNRLEELQQFCGTTEDICPAFNQRRPINDPAAPTTITRPTSTGMAAPGVHALKRMTEGRYAGPAVSGEARQQVMERMDTWNSAAYVPHKLGSFAVLINRDKSASKDAMLLGAPQLANPPTPPKSEPPDRDDVSRTWEVELVAPTFHAAGMTIPGIPSIIIGRNERYAWSLTSGNTDNTDTYVETITSIQNGLPATYLFKGEQRPFEVRSETIVIRGQGTETFPVLRTVHGPVIGTSITGANPQAFAWKFTFRNEELKMAEAFFDLQKGENLAQFEQALREVPMSFNIVFAGRNKKIKYWHVGKYPIRPEGTDPRLPLDGRGLQEWRGFLPFRDLPAATGRDQDYFVNWNNKPAPYWDQGDNVPWMVLDNPQVLPTLNEVTTVQRTLRVNLIDAFVGPRQPFRFTDLKEVPRAIGSYGTYTQVLELGARTVTDENLIPPGESGFVSWTGVPSPHFADQFPLYVRDEFKDMLFAGPGELARRLAPGWARGPGKWLGNDPPTLTYSLLPSTPNPARTRATMVYELPEAQHVTLRMYDVLGREVKTLVDGFVEAGPNQVIVDTSDLPSGLYLYRLTTPSFSRARTLMVVR